MNLKNCPPLDHLEKFLEEQLSDPEQRATSVHVSGCETCQAALERLTEEPEPAGASSVSLRLHAAARPSSPGQAPPDFLSKLKQFPPAPGAPPFTEAGPRRGEETAPPERPAIPGYEFVRELGRGGMGIVNLARQVGLNRLVALKMILAGSYAGPRELARFRQEAEAVARLRHPNIIQIYDIGESGGHPYFALEYAEGGSLSQRLRGDPQPVLPAARLVENLARAVHFAHQAGLVHRDLKPGNILLMASGGREPPDSVSPGAETESGGLRPPLADLVPKITDFGLAKRLDEEVSGSHTGEVVGTPSYMAPEQAGAKGGHIGPATDVYSLGAILYELLTGRPPFKGATSLDTVVQVLHEEPVRPTRLQPTVPRDLEIICLKCLAKEPARRYGSAAALANDLHRFRQGKSILARPVGVFERAGKWARRRPLTAALLAAVVLSIVLGFAGMYWQWQGAEWARTEAEGQRRQAARAWERARSALYFSRIAQTQLQWRVNDFASAERTLARCIPGEGQVDRRGWEWYYLHGLFHAELFSLELDHTGPGGDVVFHPEGRWIAAVVGGHLPGESDGAGEVRLWDARTGAVRNTFPCPPGMHRLAVRGDGARLALAGTDGTVAVWEADTGRQVFRHTRHTGMVAGIAFSPDGRQLASAGWDRTVRIWDAETGAVRHVLAAHGDRVQSVAFHPDGKRLAAGGWDGLVRIWDVAGGKKLQELAGHQSPLYCVAFSPDGKRLISAGSNGNMKLWDLATNQVIQSVTGHAGAVLSIAYSPDGRYLAYSGSDSTVRVWDIEAGVGRITFRGHRAAVEGISFSPDGQRLASVSPSQGLVKVWDLTRYPEFATFARTGQDVEGFAFQEDGKFLVSVTTAGKLQTWEMGTGVLRDEHYLPLSDQLISPGVLASFDPEGKRLAARSREDPRRVKIWEVAGGTEVVSLRGLTLPVSCIRFSGDGRHVVTCGWDGGAKDQPHEIKVWEAETGRLLHTQTGRGRIFNALFRPDGRWLALAGQHGLLTLVNWQTPGVRVELAGHAGDVAGLAFSSDGRVLASSSLEGRILKIWDLDDLKRGPSRKAWHTLAAPTALSELAFSPDGRRLAGINPDLVRMWDVETGQEVLTLRGAPQRHWDPPFNPRVAFSPDGTRLVGTNWDESISVWDAEVQTGDDLIADRQNARRGSADERALFWHLQEAEVCLKHANLPAARFHLQRLDKIHLPGLLRQRWDRLLEQLETAGDRRTPPSGGRSALPHPDND